MKIHLDPFSLQPASDALEVADDASYVVARCLLLDFMRSTEQSNRDVIVRQKPWIEWFGDLPQSLIARVSPLALLRQRHPNVTLPVDLTEYDAQELNLLIDIDFEPSVAGITKHFFGKLLKQPVNSDASTIYALTRFVVQNPTLLNKRYLRQLWGQYLEQLPSALEPLRMADAAFAKALGDGIYFGGNAELASDWEHDNAVWLKRVYQIQIADLQQLKILSWTKRPFKLIDAESVLEKKVKHHVKAELEKGTPPLEILSGHYSGELQAVLSAAAKVDAALLSALEARYADIIANDPQLHRQLQTLVNTELVAPPTKQDLTGLPVSEQLRVWQKWATASFIPYKFWLDQVKLPATEVLDKVEKFSNQYGDWLFTNYSTLIDDERILTNSNVRQRAQQLLSSPGSRLIWLIIDGLPDAYTALLMAALKKHGLNKIEAEYALTALPTITAIGIPALLNGLRPDASSFISDSKKRKEALVQAFPNQKVVFSNLTGNFAETLDADADLCCLHWRELDTYQHREDNEIEGTRADYIGHELDKRIGLLAAAMRANPDRRTRLLISTDHGATRCLRNESGISNKKIREAAAESHERCIKLVGKLEHEHLDAEETYHLTKAITHNQDDWVAARGYRYFGRNDHGYRHGGLSPEETIVPVLVAEMGVITVKELVISYFGKKELELGKTLKEVQFRIYNPNDFIVELRALSIAEDSKTEFVLPTQLAPNSSVTLKTRLKLPSSLRPQDKSVSLTASLEYVLQGDSHTAQASFPVPIQQANELDDFDFDNL
ncbi:hypothetical protein ACFQ48_19375 [Hymenobacter caeli]|uniref:PglZ domain-containing protein n=1 Tax=Hymenobacter caeli TaxID=2735894 RepID=A0ABX2FVA8_9BACT|nr:hypothetical protein [Hymenobacter caeli]NRT21121.1 hypothetical protein [Hymenobacter caeli]